MKSIYFLLLIFLYVENSYGQVHVGLKAGVNVAGMAIDAPVDQKMKFGFHAGGMLQAELSDKLFIQPELLYSQKGFKAPSISFAEDETVSLSYISIPVLLGYRLTKNFSVLLGPEVGFLINANSKIGDYRRDHTDLYNKLDLGLDLAIAYKMKNVGMDIRYNYGVARLGKVIVRDRNGNDTYGIMSKNRVLQIGFFFILR